MRSITSSRFDYVTTTISASFIATGSGLLTILIVGASISGVSTTVGTVTTSLIGVRLQAVTTSSTANGAKK